MTRQRVQGVVLAGLLLTLVGCGGAPSEESLRQTYAPAKARTEAEVLDDGARTEVFINMVEVKKSDSVTYPYYGFVRTKQFIRKGEKGGGDLVVLSVSDITLKYGWNGKKWEFMEAEASR